MRLIYPTSSNRTGMTEPPKLPPHRGSSRPRRLVSKDTIQRAPSKADETNHLAWWDLGGRQVVASFSEKEGVRATLFYGDTPSTKKVKLSIPNITQQTFARAKKVLLRTNLRVLHEDRRSITLGIQGGLKGGMLGPYGPQQSPSCTEGCVETVSQLCAELNSQSEPGPETRALRELAFQMIRSFAESEKGKKDVLELAELTRIADPEIVEGVLSTLVDELKDRALIDTDLLLGLSWAIKFCDPSYVNEVHLVQTLEFLNGQIASLNSSNVLSLRHQLLALTSLLDAMVMAEVKGLERQGLWKEVSKVLKGLKEKKRSVLQVSASARKEKTHPDLQVSALASYGLQGLLHISNHAGAETLYPYLRRAVHGFKGVGMLIQGWSTKSIRTLADASKEFLKTVKPSDRKEGWYYQKTHSLQLLIYGGDFDLFQDFMLEFSPLRPEVAIHLLSDLDYYIQMHAGQKGAVTCVRMLGLLGESIDRSRPLYPACAQRIKERLEVHAQDPNLKVVAREYLSMPNIDSDVQLVTLERGLPGTNLIEKAQDSLMWKLSRVCALRKQLPPESYRLYMNLEGCCDPHSAERFPLLHEINKLLAAGKKVILIQGGSGAGKSMFARKVEAELWRNFDEGKTIPILIPLASIDPSSSSIIEQSLSELGFNEEQIATLKRSRKFVIIFDGYDEIKGGKLINLYEQAAKDWDAQIIITCRTQKLARRVNYKRYFAPFQGEYPQTDEVVERFIQVFSIPQRSEYLRLYVDSQPVNWSLENYEEQIRKSPRLEFLTQTPFLLYIVAKVLPRMVDLEGPERNIEWTRRDLYNAFMEDWFEGQEERLANSGKALPPALVGLDIKYEFGAFCRELAIDMFRKKVVEVNYVPIFDLFGENAHQTLWDCYFGDDPAVTVLRDGAPLAKSSTGWSFLHRSLMEHFITVAATEELQGLRAPRTEPVVARPVAPIPKEFRSVLRQSVMTQADRLDVKSAKDVVRALSNEHLTVQEKVFLEGLASQIISRFRAIRTVDRRAIQEVIGLAGIPNKDLYSRLLESITHAINKHLLVSMPLFQALTQVVGSKQMRQVDRESLGKVVCAVVSKLESLHIEAPDDLLFHELHTLTSILNILLDKESDVFHLKIEKVEELVARVKHVTSRSKDKQVQAVAAYACQALLRTTEKSLRLNAFLRRGGFFLEGLGHLAEGFVTFNPVEVASSVCSFVEVFTAESFSGAGDSLEDGKKPLNVAQGLGDFKKIFSTSGGRQQWYETLVSCRVAIQTGDLKELEKLLKGTSNYPEHFFFLLVTFLDKRIYETQDRRLIEKLLSFSNRGEAIGKLISELHSGYEIFEGEGVEERAQSATQRGEASLCLSLKPLEEAGTDLVMQAKSDQSWKLAELYTKTVKDPAMLQEERLHIPLKGAHRRGDHPSSYFSLSEEVEKFFGQ